MTGQGGLGLVGHPLGEGGAVTDDLLHGKTTDDGSERAREGLLGERLDLLLLHQEALCGGTDGVLVAPHLDDCDAVEIQFDALTGNRVADLHHDAAAGQVEHVQTLDQGNHEDSAAHDDLLAGQVGGDQTGLRIGDCLSLLARNDVGLVRTGHPVPAGDQPDQ